MSLAIKEKIDIEKLLLDYNLITREQLKKAWEESEKGNKDTRSALIELGYVNEGAINYAISSHLDLPYVHLSPEMVDPVIVKSIPREILEGHRMVPIIRAGDEINLVMADPTDTKAIQEAEAITGCSIKVSIGLTEEILELINHIYKKEVVQIIKPTDEFLADTSGVAFVYHYLTEALSIGATHIYIEPTSREIRIRYRNADGSLNEKEPQPLNLYPGICSRLKIMANMDPEKKGIFSESNVLTRIGDKEVYLRISSLPGITGDCWTIKILERAKSSPKLDNLGISKKLLSQIKSVFKQKSGLIIVTGPPCSGKTTTIYSLLSEIVPKEKMVVTIEEAVSYQNDRFIQIESRKPLALEAAISQGADLVMIEDMSQDQILKLCFNAALSGKMILGQMHHPYAFELLDYLTRLLGEQSIAATLLMVIAQKKIRLLCDFCKETHSPPAELGLGDVSIYQAKGCKKCNSTGYQGTSYLYEVLLFNERLKEMLHQNEGLKKIEEEARHNGFTSLKKTLREKLLSGVISLEEVI